LKYLLTIPLDETVRLDVSLFVDYSPASTERRKFVSGNSSWLEVVTHSSAPRDLSRSSEAVFAPNKFVFEKPKPDITDDDEEEGDSSHKIGGRAYIMNPRQSLISSISELEARGGQHFLQLDFPADPDADVDVSWPFGDSLFNLYVERGEHGYTWSYVWQA
jgi:hypothetical protein